MRRWKRRKIRGGAYFAGTPIREKDGTTWLFSPRLGFRRMRWQYESKDGWVKKEGYWQFDEGTENRGETVTGERVVTRSNDPNDPITVAKTVDFVRGENG